ncbi:MAG TPA: mechanosensitive ion channel family protein [Steroidobacteraceae bacterium]|nr:mechanosensitive ion channel family protein [Steroidobacteraceae bacterium]
MRIYHKRQLATERVELTEIPLEVLSRTSMLFMMVLALFAGLHLLAKSPRTLMILESATTIMLFWQVGLWASAAILAWVERKRRSSLTTDRTFAGSLGVVAFIVQAIIWALILLLALSNLGINITALITGLGIGGVAVALAIQNILGDLFASLSITFDKPFYVGDFLVIDEFLGTVEHIGIKSTRLRSLSGEQIVVSNADLLKSRLRNFGRMNERRVAFTVGVTYETPAEKLEKIPAMVKEIVTAQEGTRFDRSHFAKHAAASLDIETVYYVLSADYNRYMDIQQAISLAIHREFERRGIEFAYPTQRLLLERTGARDAELSRRKLG